LHDKINSVFSYRR